jgi:hypothetical protein
MSSSTPGTRPNDLQIESPRSRWASDALIVRGGSASAVIGRFRFRDLCAASAMAVRSLGPLTTMSFRLAIGHWLVADQPAEGKKTRMSSSTVNVFAIIVRRSAR